MMKLFKLILNLMNFLNTHMEVETFCNYKYIVYVC